MARCSISKSLVHTQIKNLHRWYTYTCKKTEEH